MKIFSELDLKDKNIFIICHPRSGSTWFSMGFKHHYNFGELFSPNLVIDKISSESINYKQNIYDSLPKTNTDMIDIYKFMPKTDEDFKKFFNERIVLFNKYRKKNSNLVRIFMRQAKIEMIQKFLIYQRDFSTAQFLLLERKNKFDIFISHIISLTLGIWNNKQLNEYETLPNDLYIPLNNVKTALNAIDIFETNKNHIQHIFNPLCLNYENIIKEKETDFWSPINDRKITNLKTKINISNKDEIINDVLKSEYLWKEEIYNQLI